MNELRQSWINWKVLALWFTSLLAAALLFDSLWLTQAITHLFLPPEPMVSDPEYTRLDIAYYDNLVAVSERVRTISPAVAGAVAIANLVAVMRMHSKLSARAANNFLVGFFRGLDPWLRRARRHHLCLCRNGRSVMADVERVEEHSPAKKSSAPKSRRSPAPSAAVERPAERA